MSALVESLRQIGRDLIEKRLWPVAVLLLVALVAGPMMIGGSGEDAAAPGAVAAVEPGGAAALAATPPAAGTSTSAAKASTAKARRGETFDDPFFAPPRPKDEAAGEAAAGSAGGSTRAEAKSPSGEAAPRPGTTSAKATTAKAKAKAPPANSAAEKKLPAKTGSRTTAPRRTAPSLTYLRTAVRVNGNGGPWPRPMARLTPVGDARHPAALFLGVTTIGTRHAVFVLAADATSRGEGTCKGGPSCRMIALKAGQTRVVTVRLGDGRQRRYSLHVKSIRTVWASAARARGARAEVHEGGRRALLAMRSHPTTAAALRSTRYDQRTGSLRAVVARAVKNASE